MILNLFYLLRKREQINPKKLHNNNYYQDYYSSSEILQENYFLSRINE